MVEQKFSLELTKNGVQQTIHAKEGEAHARALKITFTVKGEVIPITGYAVTAYFEDGTHQNLTNSGNPLTFEIPAGLCESPGEKLVEIQFTRNEGTEKVYSPQFRVTVEDSIGATAEGGAIGDPTQFEKLLASDTEVQSPTVSAMVPLVESDATKLIAASYFGTASDVSALDTRLETAEGDIDDLEGAVSEIEGDISTLESGKVDKVSGKGLSTNDYTTEEQSKLANIAAGAQVNDVIDVKKSDGTSIVTSKEAILPYIPSTGELHEIQVSGSTIKYTGAELKALYDSGISCCFGGKKIEYVFQGANSKYYIVTRNREGGTSNLELVAYEVTSEKTIKSGGICLSNSFTDTEKANVASNTSARHTHSNKTVLDKFGESSGTPTYDGNPIGGGGTSALTDEQIIQVCSILADFITDGTNIIGVDSTTALAF